MRQTHLQRVKGLQQQTALRRASALRKRRRRKRRTSGPSLTAAQRQVRFDALTRMGCIVCRNETFGIIPPEIHHLRGHPWSGASQKASDAHTIPLCPLHHREGDGTHGFIGYHQSPAEFEARYGSQGQLLEQVNGLLGRMREAA
jgi:hypothetical protein